MTDITHLINLSDVTQPIPRVHGIPFDASSPGIWHSSGKWCDHCQKSDHDDAECWSTRMVPVGLPAPTPALPRKPPLRIVWKTTPAEFQAIVKRLSSTTKKPS